MPRDPLKIYRSDRQRENAWEVLDRIPDGAEFTLSQIWRGEHGPVRATYSMLRNVVNDAVGLGFVERLGRNSEWGAPRVYRRTR